MNEQYGFILHAQTKPEKAEAFAALFGAYVAASRAEAGGLGDPTLRDQQDPTLFIFYEVWQSKEHLTIHSALPHMQQFHAQRMDYLLRDFEIRPIKMLSPPATRRLV